MRFQAALFDLDGTLRDTLQDLGGSTNAVLERVGFPGHDLTAYKVLVGEGVQNLVRRALPEASRDPESVSQCVAAMRAEYGKRWADKTRPYEGIPELLDDQEAPGLACPINPTRQPRCG